MESEYKFKERYNPKSNRLQNYDYSSNGGYFITICTKDRENYFGEIVDGKMILNEIGRIVGNEILQTGIIRKNVIIDEFVIMPNHLHMVLIINNLLSVETDCNLSLQGGGNKFGPQINNLGSIIRGLKGSIKNKINSQFGGQIFFAWQTNYYDRIIRDEDELHRIRKYIRENPEKWEENKDNEENLYM